MYPMWLTDIRRCSREEAEQDSDEDGAASDPNEGDLAEDYLTDEDCRSSHECEERPSHEPELAWQKSGTKQVITSHPVAPLVHKQSRNCQEQPDDAPGDIDTSGESRDAQKAMQVDTLSEPLTTIRKRLEDCHHGGQEGGTQGAPQFKPYFEQEDQARCGMRALNNAIGRALHTPASMSHACDVYLKSARHKGLVEVRATHEKPNGWYSSEVLAQAVVTRSLFVAGHVEYVLKLEPLRFNAEALQSSVGAVVNINNDHWVALKWVDDQVWRLDSLKPRPIPMTWQSYVSYIWEHKDAYRIEVAPKPPAAQEA